MFALSCASQNYAWGRIGEESIIAKLKAASDPSFTLEATKPYAELWMGTHVNGPSKLADGTPLLDWLQANPASVGQLPEGYAQGDLPFLFKVLSIRTALSIQAHPNKQRAPILHAEKPDKYKDPNHKPEMAIALTPFEAMCGFRPVSEIQNYMVKYPELGALVGGDVLSSVSDSSSTEEKKTALRTMFRNFMDCSDDVAKAQISSICNRVGSITPVDDDEKFVLELIPRINTDFPGDRGLFCPFILNCMRLNPGEGFFMGADEPHAYISGDCIECMALSDNVIRAALTPKFKDVDELCNSLHYRCGKCEGFLTPAPLDDYTTLFRPPVAVCSEFEVERASIPISVKSYTIPTRPGASILIFLEGSCTLSQEGAETIKVGPGSIVFIAAGKDTKFEGDGTSDILFYRAHANLG